MPSQETINPSACVRAYPVVERHRFIWLWMGDPALADPALVPDMHWNDDPAWAGDGKTIHVKCDYRLVVDNLMDLTHETFVHGGSIGNEAVAEAPFDVTHGDETVTVTRWMRGIEAPPFWAAQLQKPGPVDRWQIIHFEAPGTVNIDVGVAPAGTGAPEGDRSQGVNGYVLNTMTPETDNDLSLLLGFRAQLSPDRTEAHHAKSAKESPAFSARTRSFSKPSSARSTRTRIGCSTISTSMPARCGRGA